MKKLKYIRFGSSLNAALEAKISERSEQFKIGVSAVFTDLKKEGDLMKDKVNYELSFSKSTKTDNYFLNSLKVTLNEQILNTFSFNQRNGVTSKEAYNLLRGASTMKKGYADQPRISYYYRNGQRWRWQLI